MANYTYQQIAKMIDHSLLRPEMAWEELERGVDTAIRYDVASVCVVPHYLSRLSERLAGTSIEPSTTIGFPHGAATTRTKVLEAEEAVSLGCTEVDFVINVGRAKSADWDYVTAEIQAVIEACHEGSARAKVILETCQLEDTEKERLCAICGALGADWVKTSTGFGTAGATPHDVGLLRRASPPEVQVKASGGIRSLEEVLTYRALGASRVGSSATARILDACREQLEDGAR